MSDPKEGFKHTKLYAEKYCDDAFELNGIAWYYFENESDPKKLKAALKWTDKALKMERAWFILDTKANILHALGRNKEAKAVAEEAIALAKKEGQDPKETEELLKKL
jgi:tetratricopeptide (TPR) repeat protein